VGYVDLAYVYLNAERHDDALDAVNKALDAAPLDSEALRVKAIALSEKEDDAEAEQTFETALTLDPQNHEITRDYYHHLRDTGKTDRMLALVYRVIEQEKPYCVEDYWFLADYYREGGENVKAFHYLRKAYKVMPGETELIPPMVDILIDMGHLSLAVQFLNRYVQSRGWNDVMDGFAKHKMFRGKWEQEGLRFLRYRNLSPHVFREFVFNLHFKRFLLASIILCIPVLLALSWVFFSTRGLLVAGTLIIAGIISFKTAVFFLRLGKTLPVQPVQKFAY
jgi:tetratricopeptide (TPR) repeat protein